MAQPKKLSGADLAAQLSVLPTFSVPRPIAGSEAEFMRLEVASADTGPLSGHATIQDTLLPEPPRFSQPRKPQGGRPSKAGTDGIPLNVRLSQEDHVALARLAGDLLVPGRPMPTVQDVVRGLIRGALREPHAALRLVRLAAMS